MTHLGTAKHTTFTPYIVKRHKSVWSCIIRISSSPLLASAVSVLHFMLYFSLRLPLDSHHPTSSPPWSIVVRWPICWRIRSGSNIFWLVTSSLLTGVIDLHRCLLAATTVSVQKDTLLFSLCVSAWHCIQIWLLVRVYKHWYLIIVKENVQYFDANMFISPNYAATPVKPC